MTDNEIIKAMESIASESMGDCKRDCAFYDGKVHFCGGIVAKHSLDIINRQKAEIARLQKSLVDQFDGYENIRKKARAEAIKEFVERLFERVAVKTLVGKSGDYSDGFIEATCWYDEEIDNLVKEMTEEEHDGKS